MSSGTALEDAWREHRIWSLTADRLKAAVDRARNVTLALTIASAALGALAVELKDVNADATRVLGLLAGAFVAILPFVRRGANTAAVSRWTRARSVSEALKTEVYSCLAGGSGYRAPNPERHLRQRAHQIISSAADLRPETAAVAADAKPSPDVRNVTSYIAHRLDEQVDGYYRPKAALYKQRLVRLQAVEVFLSATGAVIGFLAAYGVDAAAGWIALVTTVAAVIAAHTAAARYQRMILEYLSTADQLTYLRGQWLDEELTDSSFIDACEAVISIENQGWMARWNKDEEDQTPTETTAGESEPSRTERKG